MEVICHSKNITESYNMFMLSIPSKFKVFNPKVKGSHFKRSIVQKRILNINSRFRLNFLHAVAVRFVYELRCEKTGFRGFRTGPTQTRLYNRTWWVARGSKFRI